MKAFLFILVLTVMSAQVVADLFLRIDTHNGLNCQSSVLSTTNVYWNECWYGNPAPDLSQSKRVHYRWLDNTAYRCPGCDSTTPLDTCTALVLGQCYDDRYRYVLVDYQDIESIVSVWIVGDRSRCMSIGPTKCGVRDATCNYFSADRYFLPLTGGQCRQTGDWQFTIQRDGATVTSCARRLNEGGCSGGMPCRDYILNNNDCVGESESAVALRQRANRFISLSTVLPNDGTIPASSSAASSICNNAWILLACVCVVWLMVDE